MPNAEDIPGWMSKAELDHIDTICRCNIVLDVLEIGSFFGRSSLQWAHSMERVAGDLTQVLCVDPWMGKLLDFGQGAIDALDGKLEDRYWDLPLYDNFLINTASYPQIKPIRYYSHEFTWHKEFDPLGPDIIFIDGDHSFTAVWNDLCHSLPGGQFGAHKRTIITGHDYNHPHFDSVTKAVGAFMEANADKYTLKLTEGSSIFELHPTGKEP